MALTVAPRTTIEAPPHDMTWPHLTFLTSLLMGREYLITMTKSMIFYDDDEQYDAENVHILKCSHFLHQTQNIQESFCSE